MKKYQGKLFINMGYTSEAGRVGSSCLWADLSGWCGTRATAGFWRKPWLALWFETLSPGGDACSGPSCIAPWLSPCLSSPAFCHLSPGYGALLSAGRIIILSSPPHSFSAYSLSHLLGDLFPCSWSLPFRSSSRLHRTAWHLPCSIPNLHGEIAKVPSQL